MYEDGYYRLKGRSRRKVEVVMVWKEVFGFFDFALVHGLESGGASVDDTLFFACLISLMMYVSEFIIVFH